MPCGFSFRLDWRRLHDFEFRKVLDIDETSELAVRRRDENIVYLAFLQELHDFNGHGIFIDCDGIGCHDGFDLGVDDGRVCRDAAAEVAVGEDAEEGVVFIDDGDGAATGGGHGEQCVTDGCARTDVCGMFASTHEVFDFQGDGTANGACGIELGVVVQLEMAQMEHRHGQRVAKSGQSRGGRRWREIERAGFAWNRHGHDEFRAFAKARIRLLRDGDDVDAEAFDGGDDGEQFVRFAAVAEGEQRVLRRDDAEIAVHGFDRMHENGAGASRCKRGGHFLADVAAFADAGDDEFAAAGDGVEAASDAIDERLAEVRADGLQSFYFNIKDFCRFFQNFVIVKRLRGHVFFARIECETDVER